MSELKIAIMDGAIYRYVPNGRFGRPEIQTLINGEEWVPTNRYFCTCRFCKDANQLLVRRVLNNLVEVGDGTG